MTINVLPDFTVGLEHPLTQDLTINALEDIFVQKEQKSTLNSQTIKNLKKLLLFVLTELDWMSKTVKVNSLNVKLEKNFHCW